MPKTFSYPANKIIAYKISFWLPTFDAIFWLTLYVIEIKFQWSLMEKIKKCDEK
jgi:hypothetical protein